MTSHYDVLGVPADANPDEIRRAYRRLAQVAHPDRHAGDLAEPNRRMASANEAFRVLSNQATRAVYDRSLCMGERLDDARGGIADAELVEEPPGFHRSTRSLQVLVLALVVLTVAALFVTLTAGALSEGH